MPDFYIIAQNESDTGFDVVRSAFSRLTSEREIVALVQAKAVFPLGGVIRCKWEDGELSGRVSPDRTPSGRRSRTALFYSSVSKKEDVTDDYLEDVKKELSALLGDEISDNRLEQFKLGLKSTMQGRLARLGKFIPLCMFIFLVVIIIMLAK